MLSRFILQIPGRLQIICNHVEFHAFTDGNIDYWEIQGVEKDRRRIVWWYLFSDQHRDWRGNVIKTVYFIFTALIFFRNIVKAHASSMARYGGERGACWLFSMTYYVGKWSLDIGMIFPGSSEIVWLIYGQIKLVFLDVIPKFV